MKIVADENIVAVAENYTQHGDLILLPGRQIHAADVRDADVLLVRSITRVDRALLEGSRVRFVATATSGTDHLDLDYLASAGIGVADAAGSNANAVAEYCLAGIAELICRNQFTLKNKTVAIVGFGHVGSKLYKRLRQLNVACIVCDPFVQKLRREDAKLHGITFCTLEMALKANVISLHVPLSRSGEHATYHMLDAARLATLLPGALLINAARGEVIDNVALCQHLRQTSDLLTLIDVWENEPAINRELLQRVSLGTPHIAGYSVEAKHSASEMNYQAFLCYFGLRETGSRVASAEQSMLPKKFDWKDHDERSLAEWLRDAFAVAEVDRRLRDAQGADAAVLFDTIRKSLTSRREFGRSLFCNE